MPQVEKRCRSQHAQEKREEIISAYKHSGLNQRQFSRKTGVPTSTLSGWLRRSPPNAPRPGFVPLAVNEDSATQRPQLACIPRALEVYFRDDWRVVLPANFDIHDASRLLKLLGKLDVSAD